MVRAYVSGLRAAVRRWPLAVALFVANLVIGLGFTIAAWQWLTTSLDRSLATRTLLTDLDPNVFIDLFAHRSNSLHALTVTGMLLAALFLLLAVWLNAVAVIAVGDDAPLGECLRRGVSAYPIYFRLAVLANVLNAAGVVAGVLVGRGLSRWLSESATEMSAYWAVMAGVLVGGLVLLFSTTVHDHARIKSTASGTGALRAYAWAVGFVGGRQWRCIPLSVLLLFTGLAVWAGYQALAQLIPATSPSGVTVSLLWGESLIVFRMLLRLWTFAAATELQILSD